MFNSAVNLVINDQLRMTEQLPDYLKRISVVIPAYNELVNLSRLIPYLSELSREHEVELIVAFSDTNPHAYKELHPYKELILLPCKCKGRAAQLNRGAAIATGEILVFLHADVWPPKTFFHEIINTIKEGKEAGLFSYRFDKDNFLLNINASFTGKDGIFTGGGDQCLFISREAFEALGGFDNQQVIMEDFEFFRRLKKSGVSYKIVKEDLIVSSRKYDHNSYLRVNLSNLLLVILFKLQYPPQKLRYLHNKLIRLPHL